MFRFFKKKDDDVIKAPIISKRGTQNGIVVKDIFDIKGQGIYVTGTAEGMIRNGDQAVIIRSDETMIKTTIAQIDVNHKTVEQAVEGEECGLKLSGITSKSDLNVGDCIDIVLDQPGNISGVGSMMVEDVFTIAGRGTVATGRVEDGNIGIGDKVKIVRVGGESYTSEVTSIETFRKTIDVAQAGDNVGLLLRGVERDQIDRGDHIEVI